MKNRKVFRKNPSFVGHPAGDAIDPNTPWNIQSNVLYVSGFAIKKNTSVL